MLKNESALNGSTPPLEQEDAAGRASDDEQAAPVTESTALDGPPLLMLRHLEPQYRRSLFRR